MDIKEIDNALKKKGKRAEVLRIRLANISREVEQINREAAELFKQKLTLIENEL